MSEKRLSGDIGSSLAESGHGNQDISITNQGTSFPGQKGKLVSEQSFIRSKVRDVGKRLSESDSLGSASLARGAIRAKPTRELYKPPGISSPPFSVGGQGQEEQQGLVFKSSFKPNPTLNPQAKEFAPLSHSVSVDSANLQNMRDDFYPGSMEPQDNIVLNRTGLTITVPGRRGSVKMRSVSSGAPNHHVFEPPGVPSMVSKPQIDLSQFGFPLDIINTINKAIEDPNRVPSRSLMELVRQIMNKVVTSSAPRIAETAANLCINIIQREKRETFLESLVNICQEWYHDRERILRLDITRWNMYISFLNHMYGLLKRKQLHFLTRYEGVPPKLVLLSLLAECCTATLTSALTSIAEVETLFLVLTQIGRDLEADTPGRMSLLVTCLREAFLTQRLPPQISKTLLQLIELQAASWNLPAQAVMYYYPGTAA